MEKWELMGQAEEPQPLEDLEVLELMVDKKEDLLLEMKQLIVDW